MGMEEGKMRKGKGREKEDLGGEGRGRMEDEEGVGKKEKRRGMQRRKSRRWGRRRKEGEGGGEDGEGGVIRGRQGVFDIMDELEMIGRAVSIKFATCTVINTGDLLAGKTGATRHEVLDANDRPLDERPGSRNQNRLLQAGYEAGGPCGRRLRPQEPGQEDRRQEARRLAGGRQLQHQLQQQLLRQFLLTQCTRQGRGGRRQAG
jgi:hypothetical protein